MRKKETEKSKYRVWSQTHIIGRGDQEPKLEWEGNDINKKPKHLESDSGGTDMNIRVWTEEYNPDTNSYK